MHAGEIIADAEGWETLSSAERFSNDHLSVTDELVRTPARCAPRHWTVVRRKAAVVIAPMTADGRLVLIRQERIPIGAAIWEMPAGQIDEAAADDEAIRRIALTELREETGYELAESGELIALGMFFSSPGFTDERAQLFLAKPVVLSVQGHAHQSLESIVDCRAFSVVELWEMIARQEIRDANTLSLCARLVSRGLLAPPEMPR